MDIVEFSDVLNYLTGGKGPIATVEQIAIHMSRGKESVYAYRDGRNQPSIESVRQLHEWLVKEHGDYVVLQYLNPFMDGRRANGDVQDDLWEIHEHSTDINRLYERAKDGDPKAKQECLNRIYAVMEESKDLEAEVQQL